MDYKKYKPLSKPGKYVDCKNRNILKAYRTLCDPCATKKIEIRVSRQEAVECGLQEDANEKKNDQTLADENASAAREEDHGEVAQQIIVEEANEEEETKGEDKELPLNDQKPKDHSSDIEESQHNDDDDKINQEEESQAAKAAAAQNFSSDEDDEDKPEGEAAEEEEKPKAITLQVQR